MFTCLSPSWSCFCFFLSLFVLFFYITEETSFEEFSIPPLFPSRLPLNDEEEEDEDEPHPDLELKSDEDSLARPTGVSLLTDITSQCRRLQEMDYGKYNFYVENDFIFYN